MISGREMYKTLKSLWRLPPEQYRELAVRCAPGAHEEAFAILAKHVPVDGRVMDLAAGSGAWLLRLRNAGFIDLSAIELDVDRFGLGQVKPQPINLNGRFSEEISTDFSLVTALEIIEHLDSPRDFLRQAFNALAPRGYLLVTTPNIGHWVGRIRFLLSAEHRYFKESDYHQQRHISPISHLQMNLMCREIGFELVEFGTAGSFWGAAKRGLAAILSVPFRVVFGSRTHGDVNMYLLRKV
jgi:2-polyprenyl-3-methyl-5-hydroxy-6-metoxy-1,4-benzoquinol methylase